MDVDDPTQQEGDGDDGPARAGRKAHHVSSHKADREAMRVAARQWGALSHAQAIKAGLTDDQITYRLQTGQWKRVARKVYVVAGAPDRWEQKAMIACLAGPSGTVASHL